MYDYQQDSVKNTVAKANAALDFERRIVAMKFLFTDKEFEEADAPKAEGRMTYCKMVVRAMTGESMKSDIDNFGCFGGARALGIVVDDEFYLSGRFFEKRGLYQDLATSRAVTEKIARVQFRVKGVMVKPVEEFTSAPDVVIICTNPRNTMRLLQGYTYYFGTHDTYKMIGNQAICAESTAHPYLTNDINVSCLCAGPRTAGMKDHEMALGIPFNKFEKLIDGLCMTITAVEHTPVKDKIIEKMDTSGIKDVPILRNRNYGTPFFGRDLPYFTRQNENNPREDEESLPDIFDPDAVQTIDKKEASNSSAKTTS